MSKDKIYGWGITFLFLILLIVYTVFVPAPILMRLLDSNADPFLGISQELTTFFLMIPVYLGVLLFSIIVMWIGYTMGTTPPPEPIDLESLDLDDDDEEEGTSEESSG